MPEYRFFNKETKEYRYVFFKMNDDKVYNGEDGTEVGKWERRWTKPNASVDSISNLDPFNIQSYVDKTGQTKGSLGDLWDISKEASIRRAEKLGHEDSIKRKFFDNYEKENKVKHFYDRPDKIETDVATIDFTAPSPSLD